MLLRKTAKPGFGSLSPVVGGEALWRPTVGALWLLSNGRCPWVPSVMPYGTGLMVHIGALVLYNGPYGAQLPYGPMVPCGSLRRVVNT